MINNIEGKIQAFYIVNYFVAIPQPLLLLQTILID